MGPPVKFNVIKTLIDDRESVELFDEFGEKVIVVMKDSWDSGSTSNYYVEVLKENKNYEAELKLYNEELEKQKIEYKKNKAKLAYQNRKNRIANEKRELARLKRKYEND